MKKVILIGRWLKGKKSTVIAALKHVLCETYFGKGKRGIF